MSTKDLSVMIVNLSSDHWYILAIYPRLHRIDCLNWLPTRDIVAQSLLRIMQVYLASHDLVDPNFAFDPTQWIFRVVNSRKLPRQRNGFDCGVFTLMAMDCLISGMPMDFTEADVTRFRYTIILALRLGRAPWLETGAVDDEATLIQQLRVPVVVLGQALPAGPTVGRGTRSAVSKAAAPAMVPLTDEEKERAKWQLLYDESMKAIYGDDDPGESFEAFYTANDINYLPTRAQLTSREEHLK